MLEKCETQESLAKKAGLSDAMIGHILSGKRIGTHETHIKLCKALGITLSELLEDAPRTEQKIENSERFLNLEQDVNLLKKVVANLLKENK